MMVTQLAFAVCHVPRYLTTHICSVGHVVAIDGVAVDHDAQGGIGYALETNRNLTEVKVDVGNDFTCLHGNGVEGKGVVVAGQQIGGQHLIVCGIVGLIQDAVVQSGAVSAGSERGSPGNIGGNAVMPVKTLQIHIGGVGYGDVVAHLISGKYGSVAAFGDGNTQFLQSYRRR